jgi:zinc transporter ZupT
LLPESNDQLSSLVPNYGSLAFPLSGAGVVLTLAMEQLALILLAARRNHTVRNRHHTITSALDQEVELESSQTASTSGKNAESLMIPGTSPVSANCGHDHGAEMLLELGDVSTLHELVTLHALELSIAVHSIILGVEYGLQTSGKTLLALTLALGFHQCLEGVAVGAALQAFQKQQDNLHRQSGNSAATHGFSRCKLWSFLLVFASSISLGVAIGLALSSSQAESAANETLQGVFGAVASGSLLYVSLAEQIGRYFSHEAGSSATGQLDTRTRMIMLFSFSVGAGAMSTLATWE